MPKIKKKPGNKKTQSTKKTSNSKQPKRTRKKPYDMDITREIKRIGKLSRKALVNPYDMIITRESTRKVKPTQKALENQKIQDKIKDAKLAAKTLKEARDRARKEFEELTDLLSGTTLNSKSDSSDEFLANMMINNTLGQPRPPRNPFGR